MWYKCVQLWWTQKERPCKVPDFQQLTKSFSCLGRESNPHGRFGPRDFRTTMAFATISVCGLDYSFTVELGSLGVSCLVSAPSSFRRLGSRLPSALPVMVSLNLRHSTSLFSESALKLCLSPSCLPFHHQGLWGIAGTKIMSFF